MRAKERARQKAKEEEEAKAPKGSKGGKTPGFLDALAFGSASEKERNKMKKHAGGSNSSKKAKKGPVGSESNPMQPDTLDSRRSVNPYLDFFSKYISLLEAVQDG